MLQQVIYDGLWSLLDELLTEQRILIDAAWNLSDNYSWSTPPYSIDEHVRLRTIEAIVRVYNNAQVIVIEQCRQGWYSEREVYALYWRCAQALSSCHHVAQLRQHKDESNEMYEQARHDWFYQAHLWVRVLRRIKPFYKETRPANARKD